MNMKTGSLWWALAVFFVFALLVLPVGAQDMAVSNIFSVTEIEDLSDFDMEALIPYDEPGWTLSDGGEPEKRYEHGLSGYVYCDTMSRSVSSFSSGLTSSVDAYAHRQISFLIHITEAQGEKRAVTRAVNLTLGSGEHSLVCKGEIKGEGWKLITFDITFWKYRKNITSLKLRVDGDGHRPAYGFTEISGPYVRVSSDVGMGRFMSYGLYASGSELEILDRGGEDERLRVYLGAGRVTISGAAAVPYSDEYLNALRIVLTSDSELEEIQLAYTCFDAALGKYASRILSVPIEHGVGSFPYIITTVEVSLITSFSLILDSALGGSVTIHSIEPVAVYGGFEGERFGEISQPIWDPDKKMLTVKGSVYHGYLVSHDDYELLLYRISATESFEDVIGAGELPIARAKMSSKFSFEVSSGGLDELAAVSKYAVASVSPEGDITLLAPPASVWGDFSTSDASKGKTNIKGLVSPRISEIVDSGATYSVIDVYLDRLINSTHGGHLYNIGDKFIYFNADYVSELDYKVKNLSAAGCKAYLRLVIDARADTNVIPFASETGEEWRPTPFVAVNIEDSISEQYFFGTVDFLAGRYSAEKNGKVNGFILGRSVDIPNTFNYSSATDMVSYSVLVARAFEIMARAAVLSIPGVEVILPISDKADGALGYDTELLLTSVSQYLEDGGGLKYSLMLEGTHNPYSLDGSVLEGEEGSVLVPADGNSGYFCTDNIEYFEKFMVHLEHSFENAPNTYLYYWSPTLSRLGNVLPYAYVYSYYSVMFSEKATAFIMDMGDGLDGERAFEDFSHLFKYIDTSKNTGGLLVEHLVSLFGASDWKDLIPGYDKELIIYRDFHKEAGLESLPDSVKGSYTLWDFSGSFGVLDWFEGSGCSSVSLDMAPDGVRSLCARLSYSEGEYNYSDAVYRFAYPEDISMMSYLTFDLTVEGGGDGLYEIVIMIGGEGNRSETVVNVTDGQNATVIVSTLAQESVKSADYIRIGVRALSELQKESVNLYLKKVSAHSDKYDSSALARAVSSARAAARNTGTADDVVSQEPNYDIIIAILCIIPLSIMFVGFIDRRHKT